jgi:hypothetical protein
MTGAQYGERKHETCAYGRLSEAWFCEAGVEAATVVPLCSFPLPEPSPPALVRAWGGRVEFDRDCATCIAHKPVGIE